MHQIRAMPDGLRGFLKKGGSWEIFTPLALNSSRSSQLLAACGMSACVYFPNSCYYLE